MNKAIIMAVLTMLGSMCYSAIDSIPYTDPTDEAPWLKYRKSVKHPTAIVKQEDLDRAQENIKKYEWAAKYAANQKKNADKIAKEYTAEYLEKMVEVTTAGCTTPCPACRDKGMRWLPNNNWSWSAKSPDQITCPHCHTTFPNDKYPETIKVQSKWDPRQIFTFIDVPPFPCFGYTYSRSNPSGVIRARKLNYILNGLEALTLAYQLNSEPEHAEAIRRVLLRFAEVTPTYLVRVGYTYNEYADCDPHEAAKNIEKLPVDELVAPPNIPDRKLWTGYWSASRYSSAGMDGSFVITLAAAYDITCNAKRADGKPLYTEKERMKIEKDAIFESAYLCACDTKINNKSVGNRAGVAIAGLVLGHPGMVRFGLDGFARTVESWFLPDGGTSESTSYATMTMGGIRSYGYAFRDYTEPKSYTPPEGSKRLMHFNAVRDTNYGTCWQDLIWGLQGNFSYPPIADNREKSSLSNYYVEMIASMLPTQEHTSLLHTVVGKTPAGTASIAIYHRDMEAKSETFALPDVCFPFLQQGFFRLGPNGRQGTAVLDASNWGSHHHEDSLNLYLWKDGHELLSDLGYLWDHPDKHQTARTTAHNLVMIDNQDQITKERRGSFQFFATMPHVKAMSASSTAYPAASQYKRQLVQIDHGTNGSYWLDLFSVQGGNFRDYLFHGPNNDVKFSGLEFKAPEKAKPLIQEDDHKFCVALFPRAEGYIEIKDVSLREILPNGKRGKEMAKPLSSEMKGYGVYSGNGSFNQTVKEGVLRLDAKASKEGKVNIAALVGESNGYDAKNAFETNMRKTYELTFKQRANVTSRYSAIVWNKQKLNSDGRRYTDLKSEAPCPKDGKWHEIKIIVKFENEANQLKDYKVAAGNKGWSAVWDIDKKGYKFAVHTAGHAGEEVRLTSDWGQRSSENADRGATLPYIRLHRSGSQLDNFAVAYSGYADSKEIVKGIRTKETKDGVVAVEVETTLGKDIIIFGNGKRMELPAIKTDGTIAVIMNSGSKNETLFMLGGTRIESESGFKAKTETAWFSGNIIRCDESEGKSWFVLDGDTPKTDSWKGQALIVKDKDGFEHAYPIMKLETSKGSKIKVFTKLNQAGFIARNALTWRIPNVLEIRNRKTASQNGD